MTDKSWDFTLVDHENTQNLTVATVIQLCKHNDSLGVVHFYHSLIICV